jgi:hypothetical protein
MRDGDGLLARRPATFQVARPPLGPGEVDQQAATLLVAQIGVADIQRHLEQAGPFLVSQAPHRFVPGPGGPLDGVGSLAGDRDRGPVPGEIGQPRAKVAGIPALDRLRGHPVQVNLLRYRQAGLHSVAHQAVGEAPLARRRGRFQQAGVLGLFE